MPNCRLPGLSAVSASILAQRERQPDNGNLRHEPKGYEGIATHAACLSICFLRRAQTPDT